MMRHAPVQTAPNPSQAVRKGRRRLPRRTAARLRLLRRRATAWKRQARRAATLALVGVMTAQTPLTAYAQFGQAPMGQPQGLTNGVVNNGLARLSELNNSGPGFLYYGINAADRGLGYIGSYMTVGGFIPYAQDDLGGFWSADLRGHLSVNGGFFSNVGVVRKQLLGSGSLLGVGVYWDYDGDLYQYAGEGIGSPFGQFGHVYNQVGVSGEFLTDWGDIRSNGYMPVGTTAYTVGAPGTPFAGNYIMCQYGLDAALGGADLEVGAYIPALADWAGMISVGGYALGNDFNKWQTGSNAGQGIVPWFGGVYTRLDVTLVNNWDFSLQYNNDSYFDSTGFARLTYRMGGSRRRNVPDQLEQPMMRNEHIVRAHQTPEIVMNPQNGNAFWNVIHVNNAAAAGGDGSAEAPFTTLQQAQAVATSPWDIVYVNEGTSTLLSGTTYGGTFAFQAANQSLVGSGGNFVIAAQPGCGTLVNGNWLYTIAAQTAANPVLSNPGGASVNTNGQGGVTLANLTITGSGTGIVASGSLNDIAQPFGTTANPYDSTLSRAGATSVRNVTITGDDTANPQRGVFLTAPTGAIEFTDTTIGNMNNTSFRVDGGKADINYSGTITSDIANNGGVASTLIDINNTTGGAINLAVGGAPAGSTVPNSISDTGGFGIFLEANSNTDGINIGNVSLTDNANTAILVAADKGSTINITADAGSGIIKDTPGAAVAIDEGSPTFDYYGPITNAPTSGIGYLLQVNKISGGTVTVGGPADILSPYALSDTGNGILIQSTTGGTVNVSGANLASQGTQAILVNNSAGTFNFTDLNVTGGTANAVLLTDLTGSTTNFTNLNIATSNQSAAGFAASNAAAVNVLNANSLTTVSTTEPAINVFGASGATTLDVNFNSVTSAVTNGTGDAIVLEETGATGTVAINGAFIVGGAAGSGADVTNASGVTVSVNGVQISP